MSDDNQGETTVESGTNGPADLGVSTFAEYIAECQDELEELAEGTYAFSPLARDILEQIEAEEDSC